MFPSESQPFSFTVQAVSWLDMWHLTLAEALSEKILQVKVVPRGPVWSNIARKSVSLEFWGWSVA